MNATPIEPGNEPADRKVKRGSVPLAAAGPMTTMRLGYGMAFAGMAAVEGITPLAARLRYGREVRRLRTTLEDTHA